MRFPSRIIRRVRVPLLVLAAAAAIAPASAFAVGDTPADYPGVSDHASSAIPAPVVGDTPADHPGVTDSYTTVEVVRPERTIVRDVDEVLPILLAAFAVLIALGGAAYVLVRTRSSSPARVRGSH
jgi:hypothetical protein